MFRENVAVRPLLAWILCGMTAPAVQLLSGYDWVSVLLVAAACGIVLCVALSAPTQWPKWLWALQGLWLIVALSSCAGYTAESWPMGQTGHVVPVVMLALAAWSARRGPAIAARMAGVLLVLLAAGYSLVLGAGLYQAEWDWVGGRQRVPVLEALFLFLLPGAAVCIPKEKPGKRTLAILLFSLFVVTATVVTCGNVNPAAQVDTYGFYEMCRSLSLLGIAERFEALVCALVTVGWFLMLNMLLSSLGCAVQSVFPGKGQAAVWAGAAASAMLYLAKMPINVWLLATGGGICWGLLPVISQGLGALKNMQKK